MSDLIIEGKKQESAAQAAKAKTAAANAAAAGGGGATVSIMIPKTKEDARDVFVSVNCAPYQVKRGVRVEVPAEVAHALELAVGTQYVAEVDAVTQRTILTPQETLAVPFQYVR